ncbi:MAG: glycoside hydrolase family 127 protein [Thermoflexales bacterium]
MTARKQLVPLPHTAVRLSDCFWAPREERNRQVTLPHVYRQLERTGRIAAWDLSWQPGQPNPPHIFWDSDVAKWLEAACLSLAAHPDLRLRQHVESVVQRIIRAQPPDGYLNSYYLTMERFGLDRRWTNLRDAHELYCAGHLIEAAVAHHQATGERHFLDALMRYADYIGLTFGRQRGKLRGYCGHPEIELALVKLFRATGDRRYLRLAQYFVDERGQSPHYFDLEAQRRGEDPRTFWAGSYTYNQSHIPVREQREAVGHAVRAMYLYSAMTDLAAETNDSTLRAAVIRLWEDVIASKLYVTGGVGAHAAHEGFGKPYELPNHRAYAETCAAIGLVLWSHRLLHLEADARYADVMERALYNGALSGISLKGDRFFYANPLASDGGYQRSAWFDCACCPTNITRLLAQVGGLCYSIAADGVYIHLYAAGVAHCQVQQEDVTLLQNTAYPWDSRITLTLRLPRPLRFALYLRVPGWCPKFRLRVNGKSRRVHLKRGYAVLQQTWRDGDVVDLELDMPAQLLSAHPAVCSALGRVALQRGPLVYCFEHIDNPLCPLDHVLLPMELIWKREELDIEGLRVVALRVQALQEVWREAKRPLYAPYLPSRRRPALVTAIPYFAWANRDVSGAMRVWMRLAG